MNAEETVFSIPGLRLLILSYYLKHPDEKERISFLKKVKIKMYNKINLFCSAVELNVCMTILCLFRINIPVIR